MSTKDLVALPSDNAATWRSFDGVLEWEDELRGVGHYSSPGSAGVSVYLAGSTAFIEMPSGRGDVILDDHLPITRSDAGEIRAHWMWAPYRGLVPVSQPWVGAGAWHTWTRSIANPDRAKVEAQVKAFRDIEDEWAGDDSVAPTKEAIDNAMGFLRTAGLLVPPPIAYPNENGTVSLEWKTKLGSASVEFGRTRVAITIRRGSSSPTFVNGDVRAVEMVAIAFLIKSALESMLPVPEDSAAE